MIQQTEGICYFGGNLTGSEEHLKWPVFLPLASGPLRKALGLRGGEKRGAPSRGWVGWGRGGGRGRGRSGVWGGGWEGVLRLRVRRCLGRREVMVKGEGGGFKGI